MGRAMPRKQAKSRVVSTPRTNEPSAAPVAAAEVRTHRPPAGDPVTPDWPVGFSGQMWGVASGVLGFVVDVASMLEDAASTQVGGVPGSPSRTRNWAASRIERWNWPVQPLRIGLSMSPEAARAFVEARGAGGVTFFRLPWSLSPNAAMKTHRLDAVLCLQGEGLVVHTPESKGQDAAWFDWGTPRPLSFSSIYSRRVDPARVTLNGVDTTCPATVAFARAIAEAAAASARCGSRLSISDRLSGRRPTDEPPRCDEFGVIRAGGGMMSAFRRLATLVGEVPPGTHADSVRRVAARVVSAWFAACPDELQPGERREALESAAKLAGDEPEVMLRLAAVRIADMDDHAGLDALRRADRMLRDLPTLPGTDHAAFVQAELDARRHDAMSLGRVATGVVLSCASLSIEKLVYTQDDLLDELRFAEWLVGRDQDRALLINLTRELVRHRRGERMALPAASGKPAAATKKRASRKAA